MNTFLTLIIYLTTIYLTVYVLSIFMNGGPRERANCTHCSHIIYHGRTICQYCGQIQPQRQRMTEMLAQNRLKSCTSCSRAIPLAALICRYCEQTQRDHIRSQDTQPQILVHEPDLLRRIRLVAPSIEMPQFIPESLPQQRTVNHEDCLIANAFHLTLTPNEQQRLNLFNKGYSHAEIAELYQVPVGRVLQWEEELCQRFLTTDKVEMLSLAQQAGLTRTRNDDNRRFS